MKEIVQSSFAPEIKTLSEYDSKRLLAAYGIPVVKELVVEALAKAVAAAPEIGFPVVLKAVAPEIIHKTELNLVELNLNTEAELQAAGERLLQRVPLGTKLLVQQMVKGKRELMLGLSRDPQFGPCVTFGLGGIFAEVLQDVALRVAPFDLTEARKMIEETKARKILGQYRGMAAVDLELLCEMLVGLGRLGLEQLQVKEVDINPIIISGSQPVAVDALVILM